MQNRLFVGGRVVFLLALAGSVSACSSLTQRDRNTITGASIGAVAGAVLTGGSTAGTVGGAAVGGVIGHQVGGGKKK
ncbi:MAG: glycine zipper 2TM domain-containing protein [Burkholderiales bacterium]